MENARGHHRKGIDKIHGHWPNQPQPWYKAHGAFPKSYLRGGKKNKFTTFIKHQ